MNNGERAKKARLAFELYRTGRFTYESLAAELGISRPYTSVLLREGRDIARAAAVPICPYAAELRAGAGIPSKRTRRAGGAS